MIEVAFYAGLVEVARGRWSYVPVPGMMLRLELRDGARLYRVMALEGVTVASPGSRQAAPVQTVLDRGVRVLVEEHVQVPDDLGGMMG